MNLPSINSQTAGKISRSPWITLAILSCVGLMAMFADTMILPAIPDIIKDFKITYNASSWILASFLITGAVMTPIAGRLSDMYGKKKMLLIIVGIYTLGISVARYLYKLPNLDCCKDNARCWCIDVCYFIWYHKG